MAAIKTLTKRNFDAFLETPKIVVLYFWAQWCQPCHAFRKTFDKVAASCDDIYFGAIDTEKETELAQDFGIRSIPTIMILRDRVCVSMETGNLPESALVDLITQAQALDMDEVHKGIAKQMLES